MAPVALGLISALLAQYQIVIKLLDSEWSRQLWMSLYWIVPKVFDLGSALRQTILFDKQVNWVTPVWTSSVFAICVLLGAVLIFSKRDF
jgi:hypothetical protein